MKKGWGGLLLALMLAMVSATAVHAETRYVTDQLIIIMRATPDDGAPAVKSLRTDAAVEVLEESGDYLKVRAEGAEGYVKKRYITPDTPKMLQIERLNTERDRLQQEVAEQKARVKKLQSGNADGTAELEQQVDTLQKQLAEATKTGEAAASQLAALQKKYTTLEKSSGNVMQVVADREKLQDESERLVKELDVLQEEHTGLLRMTIAKWALTGAGILFVGWLMGKASRTRRRY